MERTYVHAQQNEERSRLDEFETETIRLQLPNIAATIYRVNFPEIQGIKLRYVTL